MLIFSFFLFVLQSCVYFISYQYVKKYFVNYSQMFYRCLFFPKKPDFEDSDTIVTMKANKICKLYEYKKIIK